MPSTKKKLAWVTAAYWFLTAYIIAALVWWYIALQTQNDEMTRLRLNQVAANAPDRAQQLAAAMDYQNRKHGQYIGEGITFMAIILLGATFVYWATRNYLRLGQQQQNFMMAVTHELKTPIAVARLNIETLQKRQLQPEQSARLLSQTLQETDRLNDLCNNILLASRLGGGKVIKQTEPIDLTEMGRATVQQFSSHGHGSWLAFSGDEGAIIQADPLLVKILLNNLVENALKYTPRDTSVEVQVKNEEEQVTLVVKDEGPGIPAEERKKVFEKFYRMGDESNRQAKGTGLGLYLVKRIAEDHKATVTLTANEPHGCIFSVRFRKA